MTKEDLIKLLKDKIAADPVKSREPFIGVGERSYSIEDLLNEVKNDTAFGRRLVDAVSKLGKQCSH